MCEQQKIFIVLEGPDMTYYGDAEIHGVYTTREAAEAKAREVSHLPGGWDPEWDRVGVEEWDVDGTQAE